MSVYEEILAWSQDRPKWQRDALRRLVNSDLSDQDMQELLGICLTEVQADITGLPLAVPQPLSEGDIPADVGGTGDVSVLAIEEVHHVNLLSPGASLQFEPNGLTVIYGDNGSGKTGFTRILKKVCRARHAGPRICPNVFEEPPNEPARAKISFAVDGEPHEYQWVDGGLSPATLARVCIFDSECAEIYVTRDNDIAYNPFGLDMFDKLAQAADNLKSRLEQRKLDYPRRCPEPPTVLRSHPRIAKFVPLDNAANVKQLALLPVFGGSLENERNALLRALNDDEPLKKANIIRGRVELLDNCRKRVVAISDIFGPAGSEQIISAIRLKNDAVRAASLLSEPGFESLLPGTGHQLWKTLWQRAVDFSEQLAFPDSKGLFTGDGAKCVLCQQPLNLDAQKRLDQFSRFMDGRSEQEIARAETSLKQTRNGVEEALVSSATDEALWNELAAHSMELRDTIKDFFHRATSVRRAVLLSIDQATFPEFEALGLDTAELDRRIDSLKAEEAMLMFRHEPEVYRTQTERLKELDAIKWLSENRDAILSDGDRLLALQSIDKAIKLTETSAITRRSTELSSRYVTDNLRQRIKTELTRLNSNELRITIARKGSKGATYHKIDIDGKKVDKFDIKDIVSEGEFRAVALAAFLAELGQSPDASAIVIDDPVSSLDHRHRRKTADRLVQEALTRPVTILTHDIVFLNDLLIAADENSLTCKVAQVCRDLGSVGVVEEGPPWHGLSSDKRVSVLGKELENRIIPLYGKDPIGYEREGAYWYGRLRETWERTVEELVLNGVVHRFCRDVQTKRLNRVVDLTDADYEIVEVNMAKASTWLAGHDAPAAVNEPMPAPEELRSDLEALESYIATLKKKRNRQPRKSS